VARAQEICAWRRTQHRDVDRWLDDLCESLERLAQFPRLGRPISDVKGLELRELVIGQYSVFYVVRGDHVVINWLHHGREPREDPGLLALF